MVSELKQKAVKGASWLGIGQVVAQLISLAVTAVLARLLWPEAFGLIGMVAAFLALLELFQELGLSSALIQRKNLTEEQLSTVFVITVACGALLAALTALASPLIVGFYNKPELATIAKLLGLSFFINSFVHVHAALLRKALDFRKLVLIRIASRLAAGAVAITLAFSGLGVYALVFQGLASNLIYSAAIWATVRWRPRVRPRLGSVWGMLRFGLNLTGASWLEWAGSYAQYLLIGRYLGAGALGIYFLACRIMLLPIRRVTEQLVKVAFPAFSAVQDDKPRVCRGFLQMKNFIALVTFPAMGGLLVVAPEAVMVVLGQKWIRAIFLIQVLALIGALQSVTVAVSFIFRSQGRTDLQFRYEIFATAATLAAFAVGLRWNIEGVAVCYAISQLIILPGKCYLAFRLIGLSFSSYYRALRAPFLSAAAMIVLVSAFTLFGLEVAHLSALPLLCCEIAVGVIVYVIALRLMAPSTYSEMLGLLKVLTGSVKRARAGNGVAEEVVSAK